MIANFNVSSALNSTILAAASNPEPEPGSGGFASTMQRALSNQAPQQQQQQPAAQQPPRQPQQPSPERPSQRSEQPVRPPEGRQGKLPGASKTEAQQPPGASSIQGRRVAANAADHKLPAKPEGSREPVAFDRRKAGHADAAASDAAGGVEAAGDPAASSPGAGKDATATASLPTLLPTLPPSLPPSMASDRVAASADQLTAGSASAGVDPLVDSEDPQAGRQPLADPGMTSTPGEDDPITAAGNSTDPAQARAARALQARNWQGASQASSAGQIGKAGPALPGTAAAAAAAALARQAAAPVGSGHKPRTDIDPRTVARGPHQDEPIHTKGRGLTLLEAQAAQAAQAARTGEPARTDAVLASQAQSLITPTVLDAHTDSASLGRSLAATEADGRSGRPAADAAGPTAASAAALRVGSSELAADGAAANPGQLAAATRSLQTLAAQVQVQVQGRQTAAGRVADPAADASSAASRSAPALGSAFASGAGLGAGNGNDFASSLHSSLGLQSGAAPALAQAGASPAGRTGEARILSSVGTPAFAAEAGLQLARFAAAGIERAQLQLHPAELGPVTVQILLDGQNAQIHLAATHAETRQALEAAMPQLAGSLRDAGLTLTGGGVFEQPRQTPQQNQSPDASGQSGRGSGGDEDKGGGQGSASGSPEDLRDAGATVNWMRRRGVVDLVA